MAHLAAPRPDELTQPGTDAAPPSRWRPTVDGVAPTGLRTKVAANLRALETLRTIDNEARPATHDEQAILSRWSSWGALPAMFDSANEQWAELRSQLEQLLTPEQWSAARRTTLNAHYTQPGVIGPVWDFVRSLGFDGGRVLEPGCGSGHFIGFAPTEVDIDWTGVELDPTTARITQLLYPQADIRTEGFEQTALADGSVDLVVGNVPFGKIALHDPRHNRAGHSIHNHFIIKSLRLCRPGGLVAVLTSRYTLDSRNDRARSTIGELGDFVTAIRLPSSTHRAVAGTDAVTDLVVFQRRTPGTTPNHARDWQATTEIDTADGSVRVNTWFADHPDLMLGEVRLGGQYRGDDLRLIGDFDSDHLRRTLTEQAVSARSRGHIVTSRVEADQPVRSDTALPVDQKHLKPGSIVVLGNDAFGRLVDGRVEPIDVSKSSRAEVRALCGLRDVLAELLDVQTEALDDAEITSLQERLSHRYDRYVARYGALNRFTWARTGRTDDNGQEIMRRNRPRMGGFRDDPDAPNVFALEVFDADDQIATKSAVFNRRLLVPRAVQAGTDDPSEAVLISLDQLGRVDLDRIADLLDTDPTDARQRLGQLVYDDPSAGQIETAAAYLSGDVRTKLDAAREAAAVDDRFQVNVDALTAVLPVDLTADEIDIRPGQSWIPTDVVEQFVTEVLDTTSVTVAHDSLTATWEIDVPTWRRSSVTMTSEWGTERKDAVALLQSAANNSPVTVYDQLDDTRVINHQATLDAREKQAELVTRFAQWVWEDRDRANRLSTIYNERFNAHVARSYDGSHLTLPGLASSFEPRAHQRAAVARILAEPTALLAHEVGAGKTATMVIASMELRRLGLVNKPMVVVPNHMLEQFCTEWRALYPAAKVLFPTAAEQGPAGRKLFVARAAVGEWDAVVVTESVFERIPLAPATEARFIERQVGELREASTRFEATMGRRSRTVKDIELRALKLEQRHKNLLHRADKDDGATFEQLGVDYLFVDEAHHAKNLGISTRLQGLGKKGSGYAAQLDIRLDWLRERYGSKVLTLSTATPIANSLSEMWVMQHYARPDRLDAAGVGPFDAWASNFAAQVTRLELAPEGTHYRIATRLAKFRNVPDLIAMFTEFADVKTTADLDLPKPALVNGSAETVVVPSDDQLRSFVAGLGERAERVRNRSVQPDEDNMLKISSEGRAAALDVRLVGLHQPVGTTKLTTAADRIAGIWQANCTRRFTDPSGNEHLRPGALQLVFAELGTPGGARWGLYEQLRHELVRRGVPRDGVRFMHEAKSPREKEQLFGAARSGAISVLVGTTEKMGVGTNVQARCVALHHLDCPWRPADVEQREGRILRQGNQNSEVEILRYVTEGSFDVYMWQTVELKAGFINQVLAGRHGGRSIDDVTSDQELSYAEVKALATGDDRIVRKAGLEADVTRLRRQRAAHFQDQSRLQRTVTSGLDRLARNQRQIATLETLGTRRVDTRGDRFSMLVENVRHTKRVDAGIVVTDLTLTTMNAARGGEGTDRHAIDVGGIPIDVRCSAAMSGVVEFAIRGTSLRFSVERDELRGLDPLRIAQRLERLATRVPDELTDARSDSEHIQQQVDAAQRRLGDVFPHDDELRRLEADLADLNDQLTERDQPATAPDPPEGLCR